MNQNPLLLDLWMIKEPGLDHQADYWHNQSTTCILHFPDTPMRHWHVSCVCTTAVWDHSENITGGGVCGWFGVLHLPILGAPSDVWRNCPPPSSLWNLHKFRHPPLKFKVLKGMEHVANIFMSFDKYLFLEVINILI